MAKAYWYRCSVPGCENRVCLMNRAFPTKEERICREHLRAREIERSIDRAYEKAVSEKEGSQK